MKMNIEKSWQNLLEDEFKKEYFLNLSDFVTYEYKSKIIYPPENLIFNGFNQSSFNDVHVVIIGQDPYHGYGQAHGLSFSVPNKIKIPHSLQNIFKEFEGLQQQLPPLFSAIKINGERLYKKARRGDTSIKLKPRNITIHTITLLEFNLPFVKFEVKCSKGTYIRSLAYDIGKKLLCGAYLYSLERTHIGHYNLKEAKDLNDIQDVF